MPYNSQIARTDIVSSPQFDAEVIKSVAQQSSALRFMRRLADMSRKQRRMPVMSVLPDAYFLAGDTSTKQTTKVQWTDVFIEAEEVAVIVPVPENVLADAEYDIWGNVRPHLVEAFGRAIDKAIFYSTNKPSTWPVGLVPGATTASASVSLAAMTDLYDAMYGEAGVMAKVEADGYLVNGHLATINMMGKFRGARDADGQPLFKADANPNSAFQYIFNGVPIQFPINGATDPNEALVISGDWNQAVYSIRQDVTYKLLDQAVISDNSGVVQYNLAQQDMVALRAVMRLGWALPNPVNPVNTNAATRYPFAVLKA